MFTIIAGALFVLSSGLMFNERFKSSIVLVGLASIIALLSSIFLLQELPGKLALLAPSEPIAKVTPRPQAPPLNKVTEAPALAPSPARSTALEIRPSKTDKEIRLPERQPVPSFATVPHDPEDLTPRRF